MPCDAAGQRIQSGTDQMTPLYHSTFWRLCGSGARNPFQPCGRPHWGAGRRFGRAAWQRRDNTVCLQYL